MNFNFLNYQTSNKIPLNTKFKDLLFKNIFSFLWIFFVIFFVQKNTIPAYGFILVVLLTSVLFEIIVLSLNHMIFKTWLEEIFLSQIIIILILFTDFMFQAYESNGSLLIMTNLWTWIDLSPFFLIDFKLQQSVLFLAGAFLVALAGTCILGFSVSYISNFELIKFCGFITLFIIAMLVNVLAGDWLLMFLGWEGIGLMSFILINFWKFRHEANKAALKAFFVNKVGDIMIIIVCVLNLAFFKNTFFLAQVIYTLDPNKHAIQIFFSFLLLGILGKSAQFFFHFWLDDAMEGPAPVSALIHAATLVTAGSFLLFKNQILFTQTYFMSILLLIGLFSALSGIFASLEQDDLKKTIAYTTLTNVGLVFVFCGLSLVNLAFFHLMTHGFYKALMFLSIGNYIHATGGEQSVIFKSISGKKIMLDYFYLVVSSMLMVGIPFLGAFYSKEPLFGLNLLSSNSIFLILLSTIFYFGIISNFSVISSFFSNTTAKSSKASLVEFHRPNLFLDLVLVILVIIAIFVPIFIFNLIFTSQNSLIAIHSISLINFESSFLLLTFAQLNSSFAITAASLLSVSLLYVSNTKQQFFSQVFPNVSLGDRIILAFINFAGISTSCIVKVSSNIFWLNEYILLEFFFFKTSKNIYNNILPKLISLNKSKNIFTIFQFLFILFIYLVCLSSIFYF